MSKILAGVPMGDSIYTSGTLGDAYIILLKLYDKNIKKIDHCSNYENFYSSISEIYSLIPSEINISFHKDYGNHVYVPGYFLDNDTYTSFPKFNLPNIDFLKLPDKYNVVSLQTGVDINKHKWRFLDNSSINIIPRDKSIILIGTDNRNISFLSEYNIIDLRNKTKLKESFSVIRSAANFFAPQGLLGFFALSQKIQTTLWLKDICEIKGMELRVDKIKEWNNYISYINLVK